MNSIILTQKKIDKFFDKVNKIPGGCWEWKRALDIRGYGHLTINNTTTNAHRVSFMIFIGEIPLGISICHKCDNPKCVNPIHLFSGTNADNMRDKMNKNRHPKGEDYSFSKLTEIQVLDILLNLNKPALEFSKKYRISESQIRAVKNGINWAHVHPEMPRLSMKKTLVLSKSDISYIKLSPKSKTQLSLEYKISRARIRNIINSNKYESIN